MQGFGAGLLGRNVAGGGFCGGVGLGLGGVFVIRGWVIIVSVGGDVDG